jgi:hypothetical protein
MYCTIPVSLDNGKNLVITELKLIQIGGKTTPIVESGYCVEDDEFYFHLLLNTSFIYKEVEKWWNK